MCFLSFFPFVSKLYVVQILYFWNSGPERRKPSLSFPLSLSLSHSFIISFLNFLEYNLIAKNWKIQKSRKNKINKNYPSSYIQR